jgi:hypothetical protein
MEERQTIIYFRDGESIVVLFYDMEIHAQYLLKCQKSVQGLE